MNYSLNKLVLMYSTERHFARNDRKKENISPWFVKKFSVYFSISVYEWSAHHH